MAEKLARPPDNLPIGVRPPDTMTEPGMVRTSCAGDNCREVYGPVTASRLAGRQTTGVEPPGYPPVTSGHASLSRRHRRRRFRGGDRLDPAARVVPGGRRAQGA